MFPKNIFLALDSHLMSFAGYKSTFLYTFLRGEKEQDEPNDNFELIIENAIGFHCMK